MKRIHNYRKVPFDAEKFYNTAKEQGVDLSELGQKIGMSQSYFHIAIQEGKINPAALIAVQKYLDFDIMDICHDCKLTLVYNGHGTKSGRIRVDWGYVEQMAHTEGYTLDKLSEVMGHSKSYLYVAKSVGGLSANMIKRLAEILGVDPESLIEDVSPEAEGIINLIDNQPY